MEMEPLLQGLEEAAPQSCCALLCCGFHLGLCLSLKPFAFWKDSEGDLPVLARVLPRAYHRWQGAAQTMFYGYSVIKSEPAFLQVPGPLIQFASH